MRISFDIDDTLVCDASVPTEREISCWRRWRYPNDCVGYGIADGGAGPQALQDLDLHFLDRSTHYLKSWFGSCGIQVGRRDQPDRARAKSRFARAVEVSSAFGIDLHVDDPGVAMGGEHRFEGGPTIPTGRRASSPRSMRGSYQ